MSKDAVDVARRLVDAFPQFDWDDEAYGEINGADAVATLGEMWEDIKKAARYGHDDDTVLVAFQIGYQMARRDSETFKAFQDAKGVAGLAEMYLNAIDGRPPVKYPN